MSRYFNVKWYRIWSDGWIEQGGQNAGQAYNGTTVTNLHKPFKNTNYHVSVTVEGSSHYVDAGWWSHKTTSSFRLHSGYNANGTTTNTCSWSCCGY